MGMFAAPDVSQEQTAICVMRQDGTHVAEAKAPTRPDAIADWLTERTEGLERVGMETGPLAVWLWNALTEGGDGFASKKRGIKQVGSREPGSR